MLAPLSEGAVLQHRRSRWLTLPGPLKGAWLYHLGPNQPSNEGDRELVCCGGGTEARRRTVRMALAIIPCYIKQ